MTGIVRGLLTWSVRALGVGVILLTAAAAAIYFLGPEAYDAFFGERDPERRRLTATLLHAGAAAVALCMGALQLSLAGRIRPWLHRLFGLVYVAAVGASAIGAALILPFALGGPFAIGGFLLLTLFWLSCTTMGVLAAVSGNAAEHRAWMMRSYALTLAGVSLRLQLLVLTGVADLSFEAVYAVTAWSSWAPNLVLCEILIAARQAPVPEASTDETPPPAPRGPTTETGPPG
jgi:uncharacterized membrane protein